MADHFREPDIRKIASLPADVILHWQAWFSLTGTATENFPNITSEVELSPAIDQQCADVMRILNE